MSDPGARIVGFAAACFFVLGAAFIMVLCDIWDWQVIGIAALLSVPLFIAVRDDVERRDPLPEWVPPWERSNAPGGLRR